MGIVQVVGLDDRPLGYPIASSNPLDGVTSFHRVGQGLPLLGTASLLGLESSLFCSLALGFLFAGLLSSDHLLLAPDQLAHIARDEQPLTNAQILRPI